MANAQKTSVVRVECPSEVSPGDFLATMRGWLDHQCILVADFRSIPLENNEGVFEVEFDNPRDARLFERRFAPGPRISPRTDRGRLSWRLRFRVKSDAQPAASLRPNGYVPAR
jgi:hypothetical protein